MINVSILDPISAKANPSEMDLKRRDFWARKANEYRELAAKFPRPKTWAVEALCG